MKIHYTGKLDKLSSIHQKKLEARFVKLGRLLDRKSEKEAHVILDAERHLHRAEITANFYDHPLVAVEAAPDHYTALNGALDKLEKQVLKLRAKWRDSKRGAGVGLKAVAAASVAAGPAWEGQPAPERRPRVVRLGQQEERKPMTLEEAMLEMEQDRDYVVYRDSETDRLSVLLRRRDGDLVLIES